MKHQLLHPKQSKQTHTAFLEYEENGRHLSKKVRTHKQQKANNALDKALRTKNLKDILEMDDY